MAVNTTTALSLVKARLNRLASDTTLDTYFQARIDAVIADLTATGIELDSSQRDLMLVVDMAVWDYQNRDHKSGMPEWLRLKRRERWIQQHTREAAEDDS